MPSHRPAPRSSIRALAAAFALALPAAAGAHASYQVSWGETLSVLALRFGTTVDELARTNGLGDPDRLLAGTTLVVPNGTGRVAAAGTHRVDWGDTLSGIAARHGTTVAALAEANGLDPRGTLLAGTRLRVPGASRAVPAPAGGWSAERALDRWADHYGVERSLVRALAWMESGYQPDVVSPVGAWGVMQVTSPAWSFVEDVLVGQPIPATADNNVRVGVAYPRHMLRVFGGDEALALAAYYQGTTSVRMDGLLPETRAYVHDVLALKLRR